MDFLFFNENIVKELFNEYGGSERKRTVVLKDGSKYLLKFPDPTRELHREISYINNAISEYVGCHIFELMGFDVQKTLLGVFITEEGKEKIACACRDICKQDANFLPLERLFEAEKIELRTLDNKKDLSFEAVIQILQSINFSQQYKNFDSNKAFEEFCDRFIVDAFIGNTDRHNGNWGFIISNSELRLAPVYDCGSALSPLLSDNEITEKMISNEAQNVMSIICDENGSRIHYRDYLMSGKNKNLDNVLLRVISRINLDKISKMIDEIPYLSEKRKNFYIMLLNERYESVLIQTLNRILGLKKSDEYKKWNSNIISDIYDKLLRPFYEMIDESSGVFYEDIQYVKNSSRIFLYRNSKCIGYGDLRKTNKNVCQFVQSLRMVGISEFNGINLSALKILNKEVNSENENNISISEDITQIHSFGKEIQY